MSRPCIACGNCQYLCANSSTIIKKSNMDYEVISTDYLRLNEICPVSNNTEENLRKEELGCYVGYVRGKDRFNSSSGGLTTFILEKLYQQRYIDRVIHVGASDHDATKFEYVISKSVEEINSNKKTRYQLVGYGNMINELISSTERTAFVGVPCMIDAMQKLSRETGINIKYYISIMCGQQKLSSYTDYLMENICEDQIDLHDVAAIDYRDKTDACNANDYSFSVKLKNGSVIRRKAKSYQLNDWGIGFLKPAACDICTNVFADTADVILGDAWIKPYSKDSLGHNVLIVRNNDIKSILDSSSSEKAIFLNKIDKQDVILSQIGALKHRTIGVLVRGHCSTSSYTVTLWNKIYYKFRMHLGSSLATEYTRSKKVSTFTVIKLFFYKIILNSRLYG